MNRGYLATGIAGLLFCLIAYIPAPLLHHWLQDDWDDQVRVFGVGGQLWRGHAARINVAGIELRAVEWRWRPQALLVGRISHRLSAQTVSGPMQAVVSSPLLGRSLRIGSLQGSLPVEQMGQGIGLPVLPFSGELRLDLDRLQLRDGRPWLAEGRADLVNLGFSFTSPPVTLGNYRAVMTTRNKTIQLEIGTDGGQLEVSGKGEVSRDGGYVLDLTLRPQATAPAPLINLLRTLGRPDAGGAYQLKRSGSFRIPDDDG